MVILFARNKGELHGATSFYNKLHKFQFLRYRQNKYPKSVRLGKVWTYHSPIGDLLLCLVEMISKDVETRGKLHFFFKNLEFLTYGIF